MDDYKDHRIERATRTAWVRVRFPTRADPAYAALLRTQGLEQEFPDLIGRGKTEKEALLNLAAGCGKFEKYSLWIFPIQSLLFQHA